ncbi:GPI-anchored surface protein, putative [Bodo saltans]|uniref:GPI-anchored surface protein, putative n=1 Tax=Bodo saltans TaxID=75058 RepID=A0A0S4JY42_BODSA|nr:GPI-anchored surface protein, putative [Bodo saltans]|eukprot:CUG94061.1 GPI-anchored surface protein, putative [Bodo saltans]
MLLRSARKTARSRISELEPSLSSPGLSATTLADDAPPSPSASSGLLLTPKVVSQPMPVQSGLSPVTPPPLSPQAAPATPPALLQFASQPVSFCQVQYDKDHIATIFTPMRLDLTATSTDTPGKYILYKLQTNMPQRYRVLPEPFGVLLRGEHSIIDIHVNLEEDIMHAASASGTAATELTSASAAAGRSRSPTTRNNNNTSFGGGDSFAERPLQQRSRSASSKSLAGLLRYRTRESVEEISAESQAAIAPLRHAKRASLMARRNSDFVSKEDHMVTRRTLQMSFLDPQQLSDASLKGSRGSFSITEGEGSLPDVTVTKPDGTTRGSSGARAAEAADKRHLDMIRVEARVVRRDLTSEEAEQLSSSRDLHRDMWSTLDPGVVEMVPIRSEPVKRSEFAQILTAAEPVGVQLLREEKETLQGNIRALQRENDFQGKHLAGLANTQAKDRANLTKEYSLVKTSLQAARSQTVRHEISVVENEETSARFHIVAESWNQWAPLVSSFVDGLNELLKREQEQQDIRRQEALELQRRFGNNPFPQDVYPLDWIAHTTVTSLIGWIAIIAAFWSAIIAPLLLGREYI